MVMSSSYNPDTGCRPCCTFGFASLLTLADRKWRADKFELKVPLHAPFLLWTSSEGLLLAFGPETKNKVLSGDNMVLVRFQQWMEF